MATKSRRSSARKPTRSAKTKSMRAGARSRSKVMASTKRRSARSKQSPVARVKRVTREVVQQATVAVTAGVETLKGFGENLVDRVRS